MKENFFIKANRVWEAFEVENDLLINYSCFWSLRKENKEKKANLLK